MKKFAIACILVAAVVGVSYLNAVRDEAREKSQYREGYSRGAAEAQTARLAADSVSSLMVQTQSAYRDSLEAVRRTRQAELDSLAGQLAEKDQQLAQLRERAKTSTSRQKTARKTDTSTNLKHTQILDFYKRKLAGLPKDLSEYERTVAMAEIREETIKKFSITGTELDKIRQGGKITD